MLSFRGLSSAAKLEFIFANRCHIHVYGILIQTFRMRQVNTEEEKTNFNCDFKYLSLLDEIT